MHVQQHLFGRQLLNIQKTDTTIEAQGDRRNKATVLSILQRRTQILKQFKGGSSIHGRRQGPVFIAFIRRQVERKGRFASHTKPRIPAPRQLWVMWFPIRPASY